MQRGCGERVAGGIYLEVAFGPFGHPLQEFYCDPAIPIDLADLDASAVGVKLYQEDGQSMVLDWVGQQYYPNAADILAESFFHDPSKPVGLAGVSRRLSSKLPPDFWAGLTAPLWLGLVHRLACISDARNLALLAGERNEIRHSLTLERYGEANNLVCPLQIKANHCQPAVLYHPDTPEWPSVESMDGTCPRLWWHDLAPKGTKPHPDGHPGLVIREMPGGSYVGWARERDQRHLPSYRPGIIARLPVTNIAVVRDPMGGRDTDNLKMLSQYALPVPVELVDA